MMRRVPGSLAVAGLALAMSLASHGMAVLWQADPDPVEVEGGGGATLAMEGTSFADMAQGRLEAVSPEGAQALRPVAAAPVAQAPVATPAPSLATTLPGAVPVAEPARAPRVAATAPAIAPAQSVDPVEVAEADRPVEAGTPPRLSARPRGRPATVMAQAEAARARRLEARASAAPVRRGNEAATDAARGTSGGTATGQAARSGPGRTQAAGNAASSNYPGLVQARILRQRMPRGAGRGTVRVSFAVAGDGALATVGLAASSGSAALDRAAVQIVRRAAPFPVPPPGAGRTFVVPVQGR